MSFTNSAVLAVGPALHFHVFPHAEKETLHLHSLSLVPRTITMNAPHPPVTLGKSACDQAVSKTQKKAPL